MSTKSDIGKISGRIRPILQRHGVVRAGIFGSMARGDDLPSSDLDLLVEFGGDASLLDRAALKIELEEALGRQVDVVRYRSLYEPIRDGILAEEVPVL